MNNLPDPYLFTHINEEELKYSEMMQYFDEYNRWLDSLKKADIDEVFRFCHNAGTSFANSN